MQSFRLNLTKLVTIYVPESLNTAYQMVQNTIRGIYNANEIPYKGISPHLS